MNLFLLLLSSTLFGLVYYFSMVRMPADLRKTYFLISTYRFVFFGMQSLFFYVVYKNAVDSFIYQKILTELTICFKEYPADILVFFKSDYAELHIHEELKNYLQTEVRVAFFLKVLLPFFTLSANNYYLTGAWITLLGSICFMPFLNLNKNTNAFFVWLPMILIPSFTIWTVGILKEAFVIPVLFFLFYLLHKIIETKGKDIAAVLLFVIFMVMAWYIKYYLVALFCLMSITYYVILYGQFSKVFIIISTCLLVLFFIGLGYVHPALHWNNFPEVVYISNHLTCTKYMYAYSCIPFDLDMTWTSILLNYPKALLHAFFSPFPWQIHNVSSLLAAVENYVFILLLLIVLYRAYTQKVQMQAVAWFALLFILLAGGLLILASPNIGSFSRYRIFYLPVYGFIVFKYSGISESEIVKHIKYYLGLK